MLNKQLEYLFENVAHMHCIVHIVTIMIFPKGVQRLGKRDLEERVGGVKLKFHQNKHPSPKVPQNQSSFTKASRLKPHHDSSTVVLNIDAQQ